MEIEEIQNDVVYQLNGHGYYLKDKTKVKVIHKRTIIIEKTGEEVLTGWVEVLKVDGIGGDICKCSDLKILPE